jgi:acetaldehyde dehydrogenase (acetylating)
MQRDFQFTIICEISMKKSKVVILGSGNIGTDLLIKVRRSPFLECTAFVGRNIGSLGMKKAHSLGVLVSDEGIRYIEQNPTSCDIVFDATSAQSHLEHAPILEKLGKFVIDLTPAKTGIMCAPVVNAGLAISQKNVNMISCGGQAAVPIAHAIALVHQKIDYIEVISSIASRSAGPATRSNLDEYIHTTEQALRVFSGAKIAKAILNLNPADPCINMQTTVLAKVMNPNIEALKKVMNDIVQQVQKYAPGYELLVAPTIENERIVVMVRMVGLGDYLPAYAGNLDIINCAALVVAEKYALNKCAYDVVEEKAYEFNLD